MRSFKQLQRVAIRKQFFLTDFHVSQPEDAISFARIRALFRSGFGFTATAETLQVWFEIKAEVPLRFMQPAVEETHLGTYLAQVCFFILTICVQFRVALSLHNAQVHATPELQ
jgi:hypothetical protein